VSPVDRLEARVDDLKRQLEHLRRENNTLRADRGDAQREARAAQSRRPKPPKPAMSLDKESVQDVGSVAAPAALAGGVVYVWLAIMDDVHARFFMGLSIDGFWQNPDILNWVTVGLTVVFSALHKFFRKHS